MPELKDLLPHVPIIVVSGALEVHQVELMPRPPDNAAEGMAWPWWPMTLRESSSHQEGGERDWNVLTREFLGDEQGKVRAARFAKVEWKKDETGRMAMR